MEEIQQKKEIKLRAPELILPWSEVVPIIKGSLERELFVPTDSDELTRPDKHINTSIPNGFQFIKNVGLGRKNMNSVLFMPTGESERFAVLDNHFAHFYNSNQLYGKFIVAQQRGNNFNPIKAQFVGTERWIYISPWKLLIISTSSMELKIIDPQNFKVLSTISSPKPILCLEFVDADEPLLLIGCVGSIAVYKFKNVFKHSKSASLVEFDSLKMVLDDLDEDDWVSHITVDPKRQLLYAAFDNNVVIYDFLTFQKITTFYEIHDESITDLIVWPDQGYWITASKDTSIKVWNTQNYVLYTLKGHLQTVTGLCLANVGSDLQYTYLLSTSLDATVRMWNLDDGKCINKINCSSEVHGIVWMKDPQFAIYTEDGIEVWVLNQFFCTYSSLSTSLFKLSTNRNVNGPKRIVGYSTDGSIIIMTPRTGEKLVIGYPVATDSNIIDGVYDSIQRILI
jgi:WD40 repeat protein